MTTPNPMNPGKRSFRSLLFNRSTVLAFVAGAAIAAAVGVSAQVAAMGGWHHGSIMDGTHSAAEVNAHVDHMLKHFYVEIDATDAQKAQIGPLVKQAVNDLLPLARRPTPRINTPWTRCLRPPSIAGTRGRARRHLQLADQAPNGWFS